MKLKYTGLLLICAATLMSSCQKESEVFSDPYAGGKDPLGIIVNKQQVPVPAAGEAGTEVTITVKGAKKYKDDGSLKFLFNGEEGEITSVTEDVIKVKVPGRASSGITSFMVGGQLVFGPDFTVLGKINKDFTYKVVNGTNNYIVRALTVQNGNNLFLGEFTNFDNKGIVREIRRIVRTLPDGTYDRTLLSGSGSNGTLRDLAVVNNFWYIGGTFSGYAQRDGISNITRLTNAGQIDTVQTATYENRTKFVSRFNGGTNGEIMHVYPSGNRVIVTGNFTYYVSRIYDQPSRLYKDSTIIDSTDVRQLARLNVDGSLDKTWRFDPNAPGYKGKLGRSLPGANGPGTTLMHSDGKILFYGQFSTFDNVNAGNIVRLKADGTIDETSNAGTGSDEFIQYVSYNATLNKYLAVGRFKSFNQTPSLYMVMLNYDGSVDQSFKPKAFEGGLPLFCKLFDDGLALINGNFKKYDNVARNGFFVTDQTGELKEGYNTIGNLSGQVFDILETTSADGKRAWLLVGSFYNFDNQPTNNMVRVTVE